MSTYTVEALLKATGGSAFAKEFEKRYALELERLDIAKTRATGEVDVDPEGGTEDETVHD